MLEQDAMVLNVKGIDVANGITESLKVEGYKLESMNLVNKDSDIYTLIFKR